MTGLKSVDKFSDAVTAATKTFKASFTKELKEFSKSIFDRYPGLESFGWTQYTPYFNDGEPCVFQIHYAEIHECCAEDLDYYIDEEEMEDFENSDEAAKEVIEFVEGLRKCEDALRSIFDDHSRISIKRDGEIEVTFFDHD